MIFDLDRLKAAVATVVRELFPNLAFLGVYTYRVSSGTGGKFSGKPEDPSIGLPDLVDIPIRGSVIGGQSVLTLNTGQSVAVCFLNGNPARPVLMLGDDSSDPRVSGLKATDGLTLQPGTDVVSVAGAGDFPSLAQKVDANFSSLVSWLTAHVHPTGVGPSGPSSPAPNSPQATACTKLKTD